MKHMTNCPAFQQSPGFDVPPSPETPPTKATKAPRSKANKEGVDSSTPPMSWADTGYEDEGLYASWVDDGGSTTITPSTPSSNTSEGTTGSTTGGTTGGTSGGSQGSTQGTKDKTTSSNTSNKENKD